MRANAWKHRRVLILVALLVAAILLSISVQYFVGPSTDSALIYQLADWYRDLGMTGVLASAGVMIASALTFLPAEVPAIANGAVYGVTGGAMLSWVSGMIGANIAFAIGRWGGSRFLGFFLNQEQSNQIVGWARQRGGLSLLVARCVPLFPFFVLNFGAGLVGMHWWTFNWASGLGMIPATLGFAILGNQMGGLTLAQTALIMGIALAAIGGVVYLVRPAMNPDRSK